jgi:hypothetical protein
MRSLTMDLGKKPAASNGSGSPASQSSTNSQGLMLPPAARPKPPRARYYAIDEQALIRYGAKPHALQGPAGTGPVTLLRLSRPHVADSHYAAEQL